MKRFLVLAIVVSFAAHAQQDVTVAGRVIGRGTEQTLPFATVTVTRAVDGAVVAGALADESGRFVLTGLPRGQYTVTSTFLGYAPESVQLLIGERNDNYDLGDIELATVGGVDEIIVSAQRQVLEANLDRRVFDLGQSFGQATGSVLDAMRGLPGVTINQDGQVLLRGSDRVAVLIDGKQSGLTGLGNQSGLDSIPAGSIATIEIINNPSAAYDAAGMAGVINIVYKKDLEEGLQTDVGLTASVGQLSRRRDDLPTDLGSFSSNPKLSPRVNIVNNNGDGGGFFMQAEVLFQEDLPNNEFTTRYYDDGTVTFSQVPENREQTQVVVRGGLNRQLDDQRSLTFSSLFDFEEHKDVAQVPYIDGATQQRYRFWFWEEREKTGHLNLVLDYKREFEQPGHELSFSAQYTRGWEDEAYFLNDRSALRNSQDETHLDAIENTLPLQVDYVRPLSSGRIETGAKIQRRWIPVDYNVNRGVDTVIYPGLGEWSKWGEDIYAGYVNYVHEKARYAVEAGLRVEQTDVYYDLPPENIYYTQSDEYDYFEPFPNVRLTWNVDDSNRLAWHYANRVDRPGEPELRIFAKYDDPELLKVGNPYLRPQFTQSQELSYERLWARGSAIVSLYRREIDDPFTRVFAIDNSNPSYSIVNRIYQNVGSGTNTGIEVLFNRDVGERWRLSGSANVYENVIDAAQTTLLFPVQRPFAVPRTEDSTWDMKLNSLLRLPNGIEAQLSFVYYAAKNIAQGREAARSSVDIGFKKPVFDARAELVVSVSDLFNEFGLRQEISGDGFDAVYENFFESQVVSVGLNYEF